jgi:predicted nucleic acid-binding protein
VTVTIDASVFVAAELQDEVAHDEAATFLGRVLIDRHVVHAPSLAVVEIAATIGRRTGRSGNARDVAENMLALPGLMLHDLDVDAAAAAASLAVELRLRAADAVYAATALATGSALVTLDRELVDRCAGVAPVFTPSGWLTRPGGN